jgi:hypothetical protein
MVFLKSSPELQEFLGIDVVDKLDRVLNSRRLICNDGTRKSDHRQCGSCLRNCHCEINGACAFNKFECVPSFPEFKLLSLAPGLGPREIQMLGKVLDYISIAF